MSWLAQWLLGRPKSLTAAQARIMIPTAVLSAFLNNTPLVAMLVPVVGDWSRRIHQSPAKLLMPLSFAAILGGTCTLVGTSTNLIVNGWLIEYQTALDPEGVHPGLGMFDLAVVGLPVTLIGIGVILLTSRWLLPDRRPVLNPADDAREYTVEMIVDTGPLVDQTIEGAGLRHLPGLYLVEIERQKQVLPAVSPNVVLQSGDRLVFAGVVESVVDLLKIRGLRPATDQVYKLDQPRTNRVLVEAVVSDSCPLVGQTIRQGRFRTHYNAAVIAVARNGTRITDRKIGDMRLRAGDTLMLEARSSFAEQQRNSRDFFLVSAIEGSGLVDYERAWIALSIVGGLVTLVALEWTTMLTGCTTARGARQAIDLRVLLVVAGALALGKGMETSGLAQLLGENLRSRPDRQRHHPCHTDRLPHQHDRLRPWWISIFRFPPLGWPDHHPHRRLQRVVHSIRMVVPSELTKADVVAAARASSSRPLLMRRRNFNLAFSCKNDTFSLLNLAFARKIPEPSHVTYSYFK